MISNTNLNTLIKLLEKFEIEVPRVQRDYAQGRRDEHSTMVRTNLLRDIKKAFSCNTMPLDLGFVYGKTEEGKFFPVDGQQRLTTLFLLHIYAFYNDITKDELLLKFSYEARTTTRDFFEALVNNRFSVFTSNVKPSDFIPDQAWFIDSWKYDPSVLSAITMLDDIINQRFNIELLKQQLEEQENPQVVFQFLSLDDLGMEDDLYIKLNARGRALSPFENFKSKFIDECGRKCPEICEEIKINLDGKWADLFWSCSKQDFDKLYLTFFEFVFCNYNLLIAEPNKDISKYWIYSVDYQAITPEIYITIKNTLNYLSSHCQNKVYKLFVDSLFSTSLYTNKIIFHAICKYLANENNNDPNEENFADWLRVIKNLVDNTRIEERDIYSNAIESINALALNKNDIINHLASENVTHLSGFNKEQFDEECQKARIIKKGNEQRNTILKAEQKLEYFSGQIRCALHYSNYETNDNVALFNNYVDKIAALFKANEPYDGILLRRALCSLGDYTILVGGRYKTLCIDDANENSRTPSLKRLFSNHDDIIGQLLDSIEPTKDIESQLNQIIVNHVISQDDWRYCFVHYPVLFTYMRSSHYRLCEAENDMLMIPNKSSTGKNYSLYLTLLQIILMESNVEFEYVTDEGTNSERFLQKDNIKVYFANNCYRIFGGDFCEWESSSGDFIDETANKIISLYQ